MSCMTILRAMMSSSRALCYLPSVKKRKHFFQLCFVDRARHRKIVAFKDSQNAKKVDEGAWQRSCLLFTNRIVQCIYNAIIRFCFCDIQNNQGLSKDCYAQASADNLYLDLDYSGCHRNLIEYFLCYLVSL